MPSFDFEGGKLNEFGPIFKRDFFVLKRPGFEVHVKPDDDALKMLMVFSTIVPEVAEGKDFLYDDDVSSDKGASKIAIDSLRERASNLVTAGYLKRKGRIFFRRPRFVYTKMGADYFWLHKL